MSIEYYVEFGERASHTGMEIEWYRHVWRWENFIFNTFICFQPVKRF